jgi:hypothetical protein
MKENCIENRKIQILCIHVRLAVQQALDWGFYIELIDQIYRTGNAETNYRVSELLENRYSQNVKSGIIRDIYFESEARDCQGSVRTLCRTVMYR